MPRVVIPLSEEERDALVELARAQVRDPRDQVRVMVRQELRKLGLLHASEEQSTLTRQQDDEKQLQEVTHGT